MGVWVRASTYRLALRQNHTAFAFAIDSYSSTKTPENTIMDTKPVKNKPTVLLVPGAWLPPSTYDTFLNLLQKAGYPTLFVPYPSLNPLDPFTADCATDSLSVREKGLLPVIETQKKDVVLVMHSYGGIPGSVAAHGLSKVQRTLEGKEGGVLGLIFICALLLGEGVGLADGNGGSLSSWVKENDVKILSFSSSSRGFFR